MLIEQPCEILVKICEFLSECDRRKCAVTCLHFCNIYQSFFRDNFLPQMFEVNDDDVNFDRMIIRWSYNYGFFVVNDKFFEVLGPSAEILVNLNNTLTFSIPFKQKNHYYPNLQSFSPFSFKIIQTQDCRLKFTHYHCHIYHVEGCPIEEIHSLNAKPCFECHFVDAFIYNLNPRNFSIRKLLNQNAYPHIALMGKRCEPVKITQPLINRTPPHIALMGKRCEPSIVSPHSTSSGNGYTSPHPNQSLLKKLKNEIKLSKNESNQSGRQFQRMIFVSKYLQKNQNVNKSQKFNKNYR